MNNTQLKKNNSYLIKNRSNNAISKIAVLEVTKSCYKIQFENTEPEYVEFHMFDKKYSVLEEFEFNTPLINMLTENL